MLISFSKYWGINLGYGYVSAFRQALMITVNTHWMSFRFLSPASSRCFCSIASFAFVASPNSFDSNRVVTASQSFRLSLGSCRCSGRTCFGTTKSVERSTRVAYSVSDNEAVEDGEIDGDAAVRRHRMRFRQHPSKTATTRAVGTCFTFVHSSCSVDSSSYVCITPSSRNCARPNHDCHIE